MGKEQKSFALNGSEFQSTVHVLMIQETNNPSNKALLDPVAPSRSPLFAASQCLAHEKESCRTFGTVPLAWWGYILVKPV